jgi:hypothetical protein
LSFPSFQQFIFLWLIDFLKEVPPLSSAILY